ncbi:hypothetical protein [Actinokineospora globicatena]|uniref:Uncharacterized protein n=1 Tax=Actinokineospora globicatena TaxID=103729 RepID=A0A9W6QNT9_9PSEU|nr:hypothetical protein [Actinokineospora globicatena]MCP2302341.1 hypothetical protein [Actinokineospora globicatena]GLW75988.1 hypothetical protein Aglo01_04700 [Actinokineospora globicatena]GLW82827.1 hypothetical protein Aglo02_04670 [Actinokineospora globicatena]GLW91828.1 hypothetical protein Aglo03_26440 [Actinokineospora globicatena]
MTGTREPISPEEALRRFPELGALVALRERQWRFHLLTENDQLVAVAATHTEERYTDAVFVFDQHHVLANRLVEDGVVWMKDGNDLVEVVNDLLSLPAPGEPGAPALVIRPSSLWIP